MWNKQLVTDLRCVLLNLKGGDGATGHMVAEDRGEGRTGGPLGQCGKRADIIENSVDEYGATLGCRGCLVNGVTAPRHAARNSQSAC